MSATTTSRTDLLLPRLPVILCVLVGSLSGGELSDRFERTWERVLRGGPPQYDQAFLLADVVPHDVRRFTNFSGDLSGRYLGAVAVSRQYRRAPVPSLDALTGEILRHQKSDGHFGNPMSALETRPDDMARLWGNGRLLIGLLEYYRADPRPEVLEAARRVGDFLVGSAVRFNAPALQRHFTSGQFATGYVCWTQNIEGLVALHQATSDERYLALARDMAERTSRHPSQHSHGFLTSLRGILHLAEVTGEPTYLAQVESEWKAIVESENWLVQGAIPEAFAPSIERDEGCTEADWLRLNLALWRMTRQPRYLDHAERTLFNGFFANQFPSGDFGHMRLSETGLEFGGARAWWCCTLHGLRAFPDVFRAVFRPSGTRLNYDLPVDGIGEIEGLRVEAISTLAQDGRIRLEVVDAEQVPRILAVRVPEWARAVRVLFRGLELPASNDNGYALFERTWHAGESLTLEFDFATRVERHRGEDLWAVFRGPWLLGVSEDSSPAFFDEPHLHNRVLFPVGDGDLQSESAGEATRPSTQDEERFRAPAAYRSLTWIPAGYTTQRQTTSLRPLSERTATKAPLRWQFWFRTQDGVDGAEGAVSTGGSFPQIGDGRLTDPVPQPPERTESGGGWLAILSVTAVVAAVMFAFVWRRRRSQTKKKN